MRVPHLPAYVIKRIKDFEVRSQQVGAERIGEIMDGVIDACKGTTLGRAVRVVEHMPDFLQRRIFGVADTHLLGTLDALLKDEDVEADSEVKAKLEEVKKKFQEQGRVAARGDKHKSVFSLRKITSFGLGSAAVGLSWVVKSWWSSGDK